MCTHEINNHPIVDCFRSPVVCLFIYLFGLAEGPTRCSMPPAVDRHGLFGYQQLHDLLGKWKTALFEGLASGENCILTLVVGSADTPPIDGSCSAIVTACLMHLKICKTLRDDPSGKPMFLTPVLPFTSAEFIGSPTERWLKKHGITHEVLVLLDDVGEVMPLAPLTQVDPSFAARIDIVQVELPKPTVLAATPTAGSCGLHVSWSAYTLLEQVSLLVPARCGQELFMGAIDGAGGEETAVKESLQLAREAVMELTGNLNAKLEGQLWNQTDSDLVVALACITKGSHAAAP
ncbi:unnamed protein product [Polarella glacialis]|uniref:Uncharacterized protein n=1 Tax=Polarella glacialis TaxID=89957 RepID=A0A813KX57_POLGL|nr:unnamed protein product [Polarella glacialis]